MAMPDRKPNPKSSAATKVAGIAAFTKFMTVLQIIADAPHKVTLAELQRLTKMPRPTLYRVIAGLKSEGLIDEEPETRTLGLGARLISLASKSWETFDLRMFARKHLEQLRTTTGETVHLAVPSGTGMVFIDKLESPQAVRMTSRVGIRVPLHATSVGKAYLSCLPSEERDGILKGLDLTRLTASTIIRRKALETELEETRRRGYALDLEENELEICCVGAAIRDRSGRAVGAVSASIPKYRFTKDVQGRYPRLVADCAANVSLMMSTLTSPPSD